MLKLNLEHLALLPCKIWVGGEISRREELEKEGWIKTFERRGARLEECVELYKELGYEVCLEPMSEEDFPPECKGCAVLASCGEYQVIFIRPKKATQ